MSIENKIINKIRIARQRNNNNWMKLLQIACKYAPIQAKKILKDINKSDKEISILLNKLAKK